MRVLKDPDLPHQINLTFEQGTSAVVVTCNCWKIDKSARQFSRHFGYAPDIPTAWAEYDKPENHNPEVPFTPRERQP